MGHALEPTAPQVAERLVGRPDQHLLAAGGQLEPGPRQPRQAARLQEHRPRERRDGLAPVAVSAVAAGTVEVGTVEVGTVEVGTVVVVPGDQGILD